MPNTSAKEDQYPDNELTLRDLILKFRNLFRFLLSRWFTLLIAGILGASIGLAYALIKKPIYVSSCAFVLDEGGSSVSQFANAASLIGIDLEGGNKNGIFSGDNIIELYKSRPMLERSLLSKADFNGRSQLLIDRFIEFNHLRKTWDSKPYLRGITFNSAGTFTRLQDSIINEIVLDLNTNYLEVSRPDKKLSIINVTVRSKDELFSKALNDLLVANVNSFYVQTKTKKAKLNVDVLQKQTDSVRRELNNAFSGVAITTDANINVNASRQILHVPTQKRSVDVQVNSAILQEVVKNLEVSKVLLLKETPLIQIIDQSILPLKKEKLGKTKGVIYGGFIGGLLVVLFLIIQKGLKRII